MLGRYCSNINRINGNGTAERNDRNVIVDEIKMYRQSTWLTKRPCELSVEHGYGGCIYADAINIDVYNHYINEFHASEIGFISGRYRFMIDEKQTQELMEVYNYEWTEEEL